MKAKFSILLCFFINYSLFAQIQPQDARIAPTTLALEEVQQAVMPLMDNESLLAAEMERRAPGVAPRFAENIKVDLSPWTDGNWENLPNGNSVWRLRILSEGAKSLNFGFTKYIMPEEGSLIIYTPDYSSVMGPFTPADNEEHEQLWTPAMDGEELIIEVQVPTMLKPELELELKFVNHDYVGFNSVVSGSCNLDVICGEADGWGIVDGYRDIIQSVAVISFGGGTFCTGFLVNNTNFDCTPYFMTANHCGVNAGNAASLVTIWNFQNSTCREPGSTASGGNGDGDESDFNTGAIWRAGSSATDFTLVELDDPVSPTANAFFAGWSVEEVAPDSSICVHHPNTDEKRISFDHDPGTINGNYIRVEDWDIGTTEGGSSGSPLFNQDKQVIGQLFGGFAACGNDEWDEYGWFAVSWEGGGSPNTRLRDWLNPNGFDIEKIDGHHQSACGTPITTDLTNIELCFPEEPVVAITVSENYETDVTLTVLGLPDGSTASFDTNPAVPGSTVNVTISGLTNGAHILQIEGAEGDNMVMSNLFQVFYLEGAPSMIALQSPPDASETSATPSFSWDDIAGANYDIEIASEVDFMNIIETSSDLNDASYAIMTPLMEEETYFWRVRGANSCGEGDWSTVFTFTTTTVVCSGVPSLDVPIPISSQGTPTITSELEITNAGIIDDIDVLNLEVNHSYVGDLDIRLTSPEGTEVQLKADNYCSGNDVILNFDDEAADPYSVLDASCGNNPAIDGTFQPFQPLSAFDGEDANGIWTLTINDVFNQDGGELIAWSLNVCATSVPDYNLTLTPGSLNSCAGEEVSFEVLVGSDFDAAGVTLNANDLPDGVTASYSENPAAPGSTVTVTLTGNASGGAYIFELEGTDGVNFNTTEVDWSIIALPADPSASFPLNGEIDMPLTIDFEWTSDNANDYEFILASDADFTNIIASGSTGVNNFSVDGLDFETTYYWQIIGNNDCGLAQSAVFSFTTVPDFSFNANPAEQTACVSDVALFSLNIGPGFNDSGVNLNAIDLPGSAGITFSENPAAPGSSVDVLIENLVSVDPGTYDINILANDGDNSVTTTVTITVIGPPAIPNLVMPADAAVMIPFGSVDFSWDATDGADAYLFELATDAAFNNIIASMSTSGTNYMTASPLDPETTYYWRVTSENNCGSSVSAVYSFTTEMENAVHELEGVEIDVHPNPTKGQVNIQLSTPMNETIEIEVYSVAGIRLQMAKIMSGHTSQTIDLTNYAAGVYIVRLQTRNASIMERIIKE